MACVDEKKVVKGLEVCRGTGRMTGISCTYTKDCPYYSGWMNVRCDLMNDALAVIRERNDLILSLEKDLCNMIVPDKQKEIVRCKDCAYWQDNNSGYPHIGCKWRGDETPDPDDFCSAGEHVK